MTIGASTNPATLNGNLATMALQLRNLCAQIKNFGEWFNGLTAAEQASAFGIVAGSQDQTNLDNCVSYLNVIAEVYFGTQGQAAVGQPAQNFDFDNGLSVLWGGQ